MKPFSLMLPALRFTYLYLLLLFTFNSPWLGPNATASALGNETDHLTLLKFKESISNDSLHSWNTSTHFCNWPGITCSPMNQRVIELNLQGYQLHGSISSQVGNLSFLRILNLRNNNLYEKIPQDLGRLVQLQTLYLDNNLLSGEIPTNLTSCSKLKGIDFSRNNLIGKIPVEIGSLGMLQVLSILTNKLTGKIPSSIGNLSSLSHLVLGDNNLEGDIPQEIGHLRNFKFIDVYSNKLSAAFGKFQKMQKLELGENNLSGDIPASIGNLSKLFYLYLGHNKLEGNIPPSIRNCQKLQYLNLSQNNLRGIIASEIFSIFSLTVLDLSQNSLCNSLSGEVGNLKNIDYLDVSENHLAGDILGTIGECMSLEYLYLQRNFFQGIIPPSLGSLKGLRHLDLSQNRLSGPIPGGLQNISVLEYLNVSFNMLDGEVPTEGIFRNASAITMSGNKKLCGGIPELHLLSCPIKDKKVANHHNFTRLIAVTICVVAFLIIFSFSLTIYWMRKRNKKPPFDSPTIEELPKVSYQDLHNGTDGFSSRNLIGSGNFGSVYKGTLDLEDKVVAIKVLNLQKKGAQKSFIAECNALRNIRHRNLVDILTCCSSIDYKGQEFKALIFEFMTNGNLESWLHSAIEFANHPRFLGLGERLNIINDVASALHYLQYECEQPVIHCDLKPSNILLDYCFVAHVSDFGLARLLSSIGVFPNQTSTIGIKGTIGYAPPEYGTGSEVSIEGDMYSFGILILEMLTGRRPTDNIFKDGQNIHNYVKNSIPNHLLQIMDPTILPEELERAGDNENLTLMHHNVKKCLLSLFRIALACSVEPPKERMSMVDVIKELNLLKNSFPSAGINGS